VVGAEVYAPLVPASRLSPWGSSGNRSRAFRVEWPRTLRSSVTACRHHRSVREPARPTSIRVAWNRERCVSLFASHASVDLAPGASLRVRRQALRRAYLHVPPLSLRAADADSLHVVPLTTLEEPEPRGTDFWRPLSHLRHGSPAPADSPLPQPPAASPCFTKAPLPRTTGGFTRGASTASRSARKG